MSLRESNIRSLLQSGQYKKKTSQVLLKMESGGCPTTDFGFGFEVLWSSCRHLAWGSGGAGFKSWLWQAGAESLGKAFYMHLLT